MMETPVHFEGMHQEPFVFVAARYLEELKVFPSKMKALREVWFTNSVRVLNHSSISRKAPFFLKILPFDVQQTIS